MKQISALSVEVEMLLRFMMEVEKIRRVVEAVEQYSTIDYQLYLIRRIRRLDVMASHLSIGEHHYKEDVK